MTNPLERVIELHDKINTAKLDSDSEWEEYQSLKQQIEKALEKANRRLSADWIKTIQCKKCKKDYFEKYPEQKCECGSYEFEEVDSFLHELMQNQRTEQDKQKIEWWNRCFENKPSNFVLITTEQDAVNKQNEQRVTALDSKIIELHELLEKFPEAKEQDWNIPEHILPMLRKIAKGIKEREPT